VTRSPFVGHACALAAALMCGGCIPTWSGQFEAGAAALAGDRVLVAVGSTRWPSYLFAWEHGQPAAEALDLDTGGAMTRRGAWYVPRALVKN
jgi:hypothetical protein